MKLKYIFLSFLSIVIASFILGYGLSFYVPFPDGTVQMNDTICFGCNDEIVEPSIITLFTIILPMTIITSLVARFFPKKKERENFD